MVRRRGRESAAPGLVPGYTQLTEIGGGAFATVFGAVEADTGRPVALKILKVDTIHAHLIETFHHEIQALAQVSDHPNIVTLYRPSTTADGRPVLVLELCRESLAQQMRASGPLSSVEVTRVGIKIAGALETAHRNGFLHRDMKPQNILVTQFGEPALADFGVAALQASAQVTAGVFGFTTLHAAPEMLEGHHLSPATDIYGLASTMYQLLTGQAPFATFENEAPASVILRILRDPVRPPRGEHIPLDLADLLEAALSKHPEGRPRSALDFAHALQAVEAAQHWPPTDYVAWGERGGPLGSGAVGLEQPPSRSDLLTGPPRAGTIHATGTHGSPAPAVAPAPPGTAEAGPKGAGADGRPVHLFPSAPGVRVEAVEPSSARNSLPPLLPPLASAPPSASPPPPLAPAQRRPSLEVPEIGARNVVIPDPAAGRGSPAVPVTDPAETPPPPATRTGPWQDFSPTPPVGSGTGPAGVASVESPAPVAPPYPVVPPHPVASGAAPRRPAFVDPDPVRHLDGDRRVESVYERTAEAGQLFSSAGGRPTPPTAQPAAPGRQIAGLAPLAIAGMAAAALIVLVAVLLVAGVI